MRSQQQTSGNLALVQNKVIVIEAAQRPDRQGPGQIHFPLRPEHRRLPQLYPGPPHHGHRGHLRKGEHQHPGIRQRGSYHHDGRLRPGGKRVHVRQHQLGRTAAWNRKNLCAQIPLSLHTQVCEAREAAGQTASEHITSLLIEYYNLKKNGGTAIMSDKTRTMASQIPEDLFQRIKAHLERERRKEWSRAGFSASAGNGTGHRQAHGPAGPAALAGLHLKADRQLLHLVGRNSALLRPRLRRGLRPLHSFLLSPRKPLRWVSAGTPSRLQLQAGRPGKRQENRLPPSLRPGNQGLAVFETPGGLCAPDLPNGGTMAHWKRCFAHCLQVRIWKTCVWTLLAPRFTNVPIFSDK